MTVPPATRGFLRLARVLDACIDGETSPLVYHQRGYRVIREQLA